MDNQFKDMCIIHIKDADYENGNKRKSYSWLLQMLVPPPPIMKADKLKMINASHWRNNKYENENKLAVKEVGLSISITDHAIFCQGKLKWVIMTNKHGIVQANYNVKNISLHRIRLWFSNAMHKRCKITSSGPGWFDPFDYEEKLKSRNQRKHENVSDVKNDNNGIFYNVFTSNFQ